MEFLSRSPEEARKKLVSDRMSTLVDLPFEVRKAILKKMAAGLHSLRDESMLKILQSRLDVLRVLKKDKAMRMIEANREVLNEMPRDEAEREGELFKKLINTLPEDERQRISNMMWEGKCYLCIPPDIKQNITEDETKRLRAEITKLKSDLTRSETNLKAIRELLARVYLEKKIATGGGVLEMLMFDNDRQPAVPVRAFFFLSPDYVFFRIENNPKPFVFPTFKYGDIPVEANSFSMTMIGNLPTVTFSADPDGLPMVTIKSTATCGVTLDSTNVAVGSIRVPPKEQLQFEVVAVDGGQSLGRGTDLFSLAVFVHEGLAPTVHSLVGPTGMFTGKVVAGKITVKEVVRIA